jgi:transposase
MVPGEASAPLSIRYIALDGDVVVLRSVGASVGARCPDCGVFSTVVHDRYRRRPADLPWRGWAVRLAVSVRRFRCLNRACARATFAEDLAAALPRRAQRTAAADAYLLRLAQASGGEAGARLAAAAGLPVSPDTLLRLLRRAGAEPAPTPRVLGVDDLSLRRRRRYATLLVDLDTHEPVDLLEGREAETLADWLRRHPGVATIVRDRAEAYADGARLGAPDAEQVADRFHLLQNASAALDELLRARRRRVEVAAAPAEPDARAPPVSRRRRQEAERRAVRVGRWEEVRRRHAAGESLRGIALQMGLNRRTVTRLAGTAMPPRNQICQPRPGGLRSPSLQPYVAHLQDRWQAGCDNISQLFREIVAQGYTSSRSLLYQALQPWRPPRSPAGARGRTRRLSVRWLCLRAPDHLDANERAALDRLLAEDADLKRGHELLQRFRAALARRDVTQLDDWLADAAASALPPFVGLAKGLRADSAAVVNAFTTSWSNGPVEGHTHRLKLIKRQGYGRAKLDLLRCRVLARPA